MHWPERRLEEYQQPREWEGYGVPTQVPTYQGPLFRGAPPGESGPMSGPGLSKKEIQKQKTLTKSGVTGSAYLHSMGGMAPGGGGGTPPTGRGGPPDDKWDDESGEEENEEDDTDEETVSVTSSSQVSAGRMRATTMERQGKRIQRRVQGVLQRTQMVPPEEEVLGMVIEDHGDTEVRGVGPDPLEGMEQWDLWDLLDQGDYQGEMDYPPLGAHLLPRD